MGRDNGDGACDGGDWDLCDDDPGEEDVYEGVPWDGYGEGQTDDAGDLVARVSLS